MCEKLINWWKINRVGQIETRVDQIICLKYTARHKWSYCNTRACQILANHMALAMTVKNSSYVNVSCFKERNIFQKRKICSLSLAQLLFCHNICSLIFIFCDQDLKYGSYGPWESCGWPLLAADLAFSTICTSNELRPAKPGTQYSNNKSLRVEVKLLWFL